MEELKKAIETLIEHTQYYVPTEDLNAGIELKPSRRWKIGDVYVYEYPAE